MSSFYREGNQYRIAGPLCAAILLLAGCGGGGGTGAALDDSHDAPPPGQIPNVHAEWDGEAVAGLTVSLRADGTDDGHIVDWAWEQIGGPDVTLFDAHSRHASFHVPPLQQDAELTFLVTVTDDEGHRGSHEITVSVQALRMEDLAPMDPQVAEDFVVFTARKDLDTRTDLYLATLDGATILRLNPPLVPNGTVSAFKISPDKRYVAYRASQDSATERELYVAAIDGSSASKVSVPLAANTSIGIDFQWSPDSELIAFRAIAPGAAPELYVNTPQGDAAVRVSGDLVAGGRVDPFRWSPDSWHIAYGAEQFIDNRREVFVSTADGSENVRVSGVPVPGMLVTRMEWSPDGDYIAYIADQNTDEVYELFASTPDGAENRRLSSTTNPTREVISFRWAPDGSRIAYFGDVISNEQFDLFSVRPDGSENTRISLNGPDRDVRQYNWSPDSSHIGYALNTADVYELYVNGPDGVGNLMISDPLPTDAIINYIQWSPDSASLLYVVNTMDENDELRVADADGSSDIQLPGPFIRGADFSLRPQWSPDSAWIGYLAEEVLNGVNKLYSASRDGAVFTEASGPQANIGLRSFVWASDSYRMIYLSDTRVADKLELFLSAADAGVVNIVLSGDIVPGGRVMQYAVE